MAKTKPCKDCPDDGCRSDIRAVCRCCELVDSDTSIKRVCWCSLCSAYICYPCRSNEPKRVIAFFSNVAEKVTDTITDIAEAIVNKVRGRKKKKDEESQDA